MELPAVFIGHTWHMYDTPDLPLSGHVAQQHGQQCMHVQAISLHPAVTPLHRNARRIHHMVLHAWGAEKTVQPEPIAACFVTTDHGRVLWQAKTLLRARDLLQEDLDVTRRH